mgnify:CR=1 FL=1
MCVTLLCRKSITDNPDQWRNYRPRRPRNAGGPGGLGALKGHTTNNFPGANVWNAECYLSWINY